MADSELPSGVVTFLFSDIEGSTRLIDELGEEGYVQALARHRRLLRDAFSSHGGVEVDTQGDAFFYAFADADEALAAAAQGQQALADGPVRVRMGLHTGEPRLTGEGYAGRELHRAARIAGSAHGGQVVLSAATRALVGGDATELGEHRLKDFPEPIPLFQLGRKRFPPLKTISNTNLPRPVSSFVGRQRERDELVALLGNATRLLTLSGPGGSGKTRLAIEAAAELVPAFKAGVFWVGLAPLRDSALVIETIAQTLGADDALPEHIAERELLLLLDNFEQVVEAAPELGRLLERCPNLKLLVTSRELLRIRGEVEYPVPPLAAPEAVELFCARSRLEPDDTIEELCRRLDDLPLALELAAARTSVLSPAQILERLSQRLDLLEGGRDAEARQRTLRATIEWSYELLDGGERDLLTGLAVFRGGCTLEAAEQVAGADLNTLQSLVHKNLLRRTNERFWMLETIGEYVRERLAENAGEPGLRRRHALYFLQLAEEAERDVDAGGSVAEQLERLASEHDNLRAALEWARDSRESEILLRLVAALGSYWRIRGFFGELRTWLPLALERASSPARARMKALLGAALLALSDGDLSRVEAPASELRRAAEQADDKRYLMHAMTLSGRVALASGDLGGAGRHYTAVRDLAAEIGDRGSEASATVNIGVVATTSGDFRAGLEHAAAAVALFRELGDETGIAVGAVNSGWSALALGDAAVAERWFRESLAVAGRLGAVSWIAIGGAGLGSALVARQEEDLGARLLGAAAALREELGIGLSDELEEQLHERAVAAATTALGEEAFAAAWARGRAMTPDEIVESCAAEL